MAIVKTKVPSKALVVNSDVTSLLNKACSASKSMLAYCQEAGKLASKDFDKELGMPSYNAILALYKDAISNDANVKRNFANALLLACFGDTPVSIEVNGKEQHGRAADFVNASKHAAVEAAKEVRQALGVGRNTSARKPSDTAKIVNPTGLSNKAVLLLVQQRMDKAEFVEQLSAALGELGYKVTKSRSKK